MSSSENKKYWVGFDLGGTKMLSTVFDASFQPLGRKRKRTKATEGEDFGLKRIANTIRQSLEDAKADLSEIAGIGVGCPGPIELDKGIIQEAPNLGWENVPLLEYLKKEFKCPVVVLNDVDAGVYAEYRFGAAKKARCVLGVFPGTGIGGGCVYEGRIVRGRKISCMEIGHIPVTSPGPLSGTRQRGTLEQVASRLAISGAVAQAAYRGDAPTVKKLAGTDLSNIRSGVLAEAIRSGDVVVENIVREAAELIGVTLAGVIHLLSPDTIVMGGGLIEAIPEIFISGVTDAAKRTVLSSFLDTFKIVPAALGDDASVMGAAAWAEETFLTDS